MMEVSPGDLVRFTCMLPDGVAERVGQVFSTTRYRKTQGRWFIVVRPLDGDPQDRGTALCTVYPEQICSVLIPHRFLLKMNSFEYREDAAGKRVGRLSGKFRYPESPVVLRGYKDGSAKLHDPAGVEFWRDPRNVASEMDVPQL